MVTLADMAQKLGLSVSTVSRALNPRTARLISVPVRTRIQTFAARSGYLPNRTAQELVRGRSQSIGVVVSTEFNSLFFNDHLAKSLAGLYAALRDHGEYGCKLVVLPRGQSLSEIDQLILQTRVDGLLIS